MIKQFDWLNVDFGVLELSKMTFDKKSLSRRYLCTVNVFVSRAECEREKLLNSSLSKMHCIYIE